MSHELKQHDIQEGREQAWHGLTRINPELSLGNCWLNSWDYAPKPVIVDGKPTPFSVLGVTDDATMKDEETGEESALLIGRPYQTKTFKPILNLRMLEVLDKALDGCGLTLESVGTVFNRGRLFLSFALKDGKFEVAGQNYDAFLNIGNGNDMSSPFWLNTSNTKTVCNNTFTLNMDDAAMIMSVKKTQFSDLKIENLKPAIEAALKGQKEFARVIARLMGVECDETTAREFFAGFLAPDTNKPLSTRAAGNVDRLVQLFNSGAGNDGNDFNDVFQAGTDFFTHEAASAKGDNKANWKNFVSSEFGSGRNEKMRLWDLLQNRDTRKGVVTIGKHVLKLTADEARKEQAA